MSSNKKPRWPEEYELMSMVVELFWLSLLVPHRTAPMILRLNFSWYAVRLMVALALVLDAMALTLSQMVNQIESFAFSSLILIQVASFFLTIYGAYFVGKLFGGTGSLIKTFVIICWMNLIIVLFQIAQIILSGILRSVPELGFIGSFLDPLINGFPVFLFFWLFVHFVKVLHGFQSAIKVLGGTILAILTIAFGILTMSALFLPFTP